MTTNTYLHVPYAEKDAAKALGARWDRNQRQWYIPTGIAIDSFSRWLPAQATLISTKPVVEETAAPYLVQTQTEHGISLLQLLSKVQSTVEHTFHTGVWVLVEVIEARSNNGHLYLELSERSADGRVIANARGMIWASTAQRLLPEFEKRTGVILAAGIKLLLQATPTFHVQYGLSLKIDAINVDYTLGDLEATKKAIRHRLQQEGIFQANKQLPTPWDYHNIIVISPESAAGLGDFKAEAQRLQHLGLCQFIYAHSRFQGEGAAQEVAVTLMNTVNTQQKLGRKIDAVVIIRGGGAVNDLAWLNQYELIKAVCTLTIPVLTGIGHERDSTVLDEVAHRHFDTPSKVIAGIEQLIFQRTAEAKAMYQSITTTAQQQLTAQATKVANDFASIQNNALNRLTQARQTTQRDLQTVEYEARRSLHNALSASTALFREIAGQGPEKTLARGFALVHKGSKVVTSSNGIQTGDALEIKFKDSQLTVTAQEQL